MPSSSLNWSARANRYVDLVTSRRFWSWSLALVALGFVARIPGIPVGPYGFYGFRQSQTAMVVQQFMENGFDVRSPLPVFGPPFFVPMEFPLFQGIAAVLGSVFGLTAAQAAGLLSLILFEGSVLVLAVLLRRWFDDRTALLAVLLAQLVPFGWLWGPASLIEFLPVLLSLASLVCIDRWVTRPRAWLVVLAAVLQVTSFLVKPTTSVVMLPLLLVPLWGVARPWRRTSLTAVAWILTPTLLGLIAAAGWTRFADSVKADSAFTAFLTSRNLVTWNFGTPGQRLTPAQLASYGENLAAIAGPLLLLLATVMVAVVLNPRRVEPWALALVPVTAYAVFTNLFVVHAYYSAAVMLPVVAVLAVALSSVRRQFTDPLQGRLAAGFGAVILLVAAWTSAEGAKAQDFFTDFPEPALAAEVRALTTAADGVIVVGCDWDPQLLYAADRRGLMLRGTDDPPIPTEWLGRDLTYVAYCADSRTPPALPDGVTLTRVSDHLDAVTRRTT